MKFNKLTNHYLKVLTEASQYYALSYESQVMPMNKPLSHINKLGSLTKQFEAGEFQTPEMDAFKELAGEQAFQGEYEGEGVGFGHSTIRYIYPSTEAIDIIIDQFKDYLVNELKFEVTSDGPARGSYRTVKFFKPNGGGAMLEAVPTGSG